MHVQHWQGAQTPSPHPPKIFCRLLALAGPIAVQDLLNLGTITIMTGFVGRLGPDQLSAMVLASSVGAVFGQSLLVGISSGMETLCGQVLQIGQCILSNFFKSLSLKVIGLLDIAFFIK